MRPEILPTQPRSIARDTWLIPTLALDPMHEPAHAMRDRIREGNRQ